VEIVANEMIILGERRDASESTSSEAETVEEDEFPF
jgi:hypothetical protein